MSDGFAEMIPRALEFFDRLKADNTRDFYEKHKDFYRDEIRKPAGLMADLFAEDLARHTARPHGSKVFRIHRDVRFSRDKTPYNTHLHLLWSRPGDAVAPAWFFGAAPDYLTFGMGVMGLEKDALTRFREMVDRRGDTLADAMAGAETRAAVTLSDWGPPPLKRVPKPYAPDHPHAGLLKRKAFAIHAPLPEGWQDAGLLPSLNALVPPMLPIWRILDETFAG
jgi:uncharacterized protein (TIGR02453 family)